MESIGSPLLWIGFSSFVLLMLALDLGVFHRKAHSVSMREAAIWSAVWIGLALIFNAGIWIWFGQQPALEFLTGYVVEKSLSIDNLFVFLLIFGYFAVPAAYQHRVLFWGIIGALVMRAIFIAAGAVLLERFHWMIYFFGGLLVVTGIRMLWSGREMDPESNPAVKLFRRFVPITPGYSGKNFFVRQNGKWLATPLLVVLVSVEASDLLFAVDSIPAIFAITRDPFLVFTSNIFALLGLRSLYFLLAGVMARFAYLKYGLAILLVFVGAKMLLADIYKVPIMVSLSVIAALLGGTMLFSFLKARKGVPAAAELQAAPRQDPLD